MSAFTSQIRRIMPWVWLGSIVLVGIPVVVIAGVRGKVDVEVALLVTGAFVYAVLGLVIAVRQPGNGVAWILFLVATGIVLSGVSELVIDESSNSESIVYALAVIWSNVGYWVAIILPLLLLLFIFPTGHFLTRRWSWAGWATAIMSATLLFAEGLTSEIGLIGETATVHNPLGVHDLGGIETGLASWVVGICMLALIAGGPVAMVFRYRRSSALVRAQIKLVLGAMAFIPILMLTGTLFDSGWVNTVVFLTAMAVVPLAMTVAIVRHNLFDIDLVISRSLTFGALAVFIGVVYVGIVVGVGALLGRGGGTGLGLSVAATAVVALGFQPMRVRVERWANRLVYGKRATPYEVLASFSHRATDESDEDVLARIPQLIVDGTGAAGAVMWVRSGAGFRSASAWPEADVVRRLEGSEFDDGESDVSLPVFHDGELLGGISMTAARGGSVTPPELELVESLADGLGLTLRNARLTAALRRQVKDLQRSRDRIVSAADAARRSLEHDLDSGPQQQLVAVKVKLGPVRKLAEDAGATRTAGLLADIESQAGDAIQAVRDFAAGVYPPLLGAEGLTVALAQETRKGAVPVILESDDLGRYPRDVESAVYFTILEALQNTAKYAEATHATVRLTARNGDLRFEVTDDGRGFDAATIERGAGLSGIADRIDTIGGTWAITSTPELGTTITGSIPVSDPVPV